MASHIQKHFKGFGPKQSRNVLQSLGLTRYEIPIDSRLTDWLNEFGFPVRLSAQALGDHNYYAFVSHSFSCCANARASSPVFLVLQCSRQVTKTSGQKTISPSSRSVDCSSMELLALPHASNGEAERNFYLASGQSHPE